MCVFPHQPSDPGQKGWWSHFLYQNAFESVCVHLPSISHDRDNWVWIWISSILQESDRISKAGEDDEEEEEEEEADPSALQLHWGLEGLISRPSEAVTHSKRHQSEPLSRGSSPTRRPRVFSCLGWITNTSPAPAHFSSLVRFSSYLLYATASFYPQLGRNSLPKVSCQNILVF